MCNKCIYKRICKFVAFELLKNAPDTPCQRFREIPPYNATENEEIYLI